MSAPQRLSRGFHRLALFLAAIPLVVGGVVSVYIASDGAKRWYDEQVTLVCAQDAFHKKFYADLPRDEFDRRMAAKLAPIEAGEVKLTDPDLKELGCSDWPRTVSVLEIFRARPPGELSWAAQISSYLATGLAITLGLSLGIYGSRDRLGHWRLRVAIAQEGARCSPVWQRSFWSSPSLSHQPRYPSRLRLRAYKSVARKKCLSMGATPRVAC